MSRFHFAIIFAVVLLGYFLLFEDVTLPWSMKPQLPDEVESLEPARPEMIDNPYDQAGK